MREAVARIKQEMARLAFNGKASRLRGIIVSSAVWAALHEDSELFHGVLGVTSTEGNRVVRYSFYVLENPHFPKQGQDFFFVPYTQETYRERYLGREESILTHGERVEQVGDADVRVLNEITGVLVADGRYLYDVDCDAVITKARSLSPNERWDYISEINWHGEITNPPQTSWIKKPETYDYLRTTVQASMGRLLMCRTNAGTFAMVGVGMNGFKTHIDVVMKSSLTADALVFAKLAVQYFLPEEVSDFLAQFNVIVPVEELQASVGREYWGTVGDSEGAGRLKSYNRYNGSKRSFILSADFLATRGNSISVTFAEVETEAAFELLEALHFPPGWQKWPDTAQDRAFASMAQSLADS